MTRTGSRGGRVFLLEIGTEEIPARMVDPALADLGRALHEAITARHLAPDAGFTLKTNFESFGTPRRLAVRVHDLLARQPDTEVEVTGPPVKAAFDPSGRPTRAAEGFARAQGVDVAALRRLATPKGECVGVRRKVAGLDASEVLAQAVPPIVAALTFPKMMRWGTGEHRFVRPIHSLVALLDDLVVDMMIAGIRSGRETFGHRVLGQPRISLSSPEAYSEALRASHVLA
ncbi:MAG TPA: glycine--tRNA ligase subunit beta, partial [Candidatus Polarisedimenticolia bacterium]|nr:glycine--tRNA ligase subunit beta [Candidatus Polarisedimenticolia bacterium]